MGSKRDIIVLDLETQKSFKEVGGKSRANYLEKLKVSVVGVYEYKTDSYMIYEESEIMKLEKRLREVELLVGFNSRRFDLPVLAPYLFMNIDDIPQLDLLEDVEKERGHRASLDSLAGPTLKMHKSGSGKDAITLYKDGRMDELKSYCLDDVRITKEIFDYGCREGKVFFTSNWDYKTYEIPVDWKKTSDSIISKASSTEESFPSSLF